MADTATAQPSGLDRSTIRINRLKGGYTWNVFVVTDENGQDALQQAKQQAIEIVRELEKEFTAAKSDDNDVPF
jgi:hypothetical protein